jgi:hypothetical protein
MNGQLPDKSLSPIFQGRLINQAAAAWNSMNVEARAKGLELYPTGLASSYRTLAQQKALYALYKAGGNLAAVPGTSNHGWGLAVDVPTLLMRKMIDQIGEKYGWSKKWSDAPSEWWHIKYEVGHWTGTDPGPKGEGTKETTQEEYDMRLAIGYNADGRVQLASLDKNGNPSTNYVSKKTGTWAGWDKWNKGDAKAFVSLQFARHPDGHLECFAKDADDVTWRIHQKGPNGAWADKFFRV